MASDGKSEQVVAWFLNLIFQHENVKSVGNLSNCSSDICCLCCPSTDVGGMSTGHYELVVDGLLANVGIGIVPLLRSSSLVTRVPVPICTGTDPVATRVVE